MFISKFNQWLDEVDPYALQRISLYKCLLVASIEVYVYWFCRPVNFMAFISPFIVISLVEAPVLSSFKQKEQLVVFTTIAIILISVSFYLVYPFRVTFFFFSIIVLAVTYFTVLKYFYALKNMALLLITMGSIVLSTEPPANLQVAYGFISSTLLSMASTFICLKFSPNLYLIVWNRALHKFIECLEKDIHSALYKDQPPPTGEEIQHLGIVRNYRRLMPKKYLKQAYRIAVNVRNIQHALDNLYYETKDELFWIGVKNNLNYMRHNMKNYTSCGLPQISKKPTTKLQHYVVYCLQQVFIHWNKLCSLHQH